MKIIHNSVIPFGKDYAAINLFGVLFVKRPYRVNDVMLNHELIHTYQMREMLFIPFYIVYVLEWAIRLFQFRGNSYMAYRNISFEREAYENERNLNYLKGRKIFGQWRGIPLTFSSGHNQERMERD